MFSLYRMYLTPRHGSYCASGSSTASPLTFGINCMGLPIQQRIECKVCVLVYKCLHEAAPIYLAVMVTTVSASVSRRFSVPQHTAVWQYLVAEPYDEIWTKKLRRLRSGRVEPSAANHA